MDETLVGGHLEAGGGRRHLGKKALVVFAAEVRGRAISGSMPLTFVRTRCSLARW